MFLVSVPGNRARTTPGSDYRPDAIPEFISQRRRWLNGAFFAAVYSLLHFKQVWQTDHSLTRKILLHIEFVYQFINLLFTFFALVSRRTCTPLTSTADKPRRISTLPSTSSPGP